MTDPSKSATAAPKLSVALTDLITLFALGAFIGSAFCVGRLMPGFFPVAAYFGLLSLFHAMEYLVTAAFQPDKVDFKSFLLDHSTEYAAAVLASLAEHVLELYFFPGLKSWLCIFRYLGLAIALLGQLIRIAAMAEAGDNFSHMIAEKKQPGHRLVTTGIYKYMRHPAYTGFYFWSLGSQLVLGNPICLGLFVKVLNNFFQERIAYEEETLVKFFAGDYSRYKSMTRSGFFHIP